MKKADRNKTGIVFNVQKFSVNDGPGIRTVVFFKGCPLRCRWCSNPESQLPKIQILHDSKKCIHCLHCIQICPAKAITATEKTLHINSTLCTGCKTCAMQCPAKALETAGEVKSVNEIINTVIQDRVFYEESGGGITLSGGEFLTQPDFAEELLLAAKEENLHTCCETTGFARAEIFDRIIPYIDYVLFDMKHWDAEKHKNGTGVSNELILANLKHAVQLQKTVLPRIPVIPDFNNSPEDAANFARLLREIGIDQCQLLPFHQFGENKYNLLDKPYEYADVPALHREELEDYRNIFLQHGINAFF